MTLTPQHKRRTEHDNSQPRSYAELTDRLATHGPAALQGELCHLIRHARRSGVTPLLVTILADPNQPDVARQRAFGRIIAELARLQESQPHRANRRSEIHDLPSTRLNPHERRSA